MGVSKAIRSLAKIEGKEDSLALHRILECAMTEEEAIFILDLPKATAELAQKFRMTEGDVEEKLQGLARRGLIVNSSKGLRFPRDLATLHDNILASPRDAIPAEMADLWMELYEGEGWAEEIGNGLAQFPAPALRTIPILDSTPPGARLLRFEDIAAIIEHNKDLISLRHCCCRTGAEKCSHPKEVCIQFGKRAEYDLYRGSGRKLSAEEAIEISREAGNSGLVPTVVNMAKMEAMEFICFCCGCCCLVIDPAKRVDSMDKILAPSRFLSVVDYEKCDACLVCVKRCPLDAIEMQKVVGFDLEKAVIDEQKCVGCGACVPACPYETGITLKRIRPPEFIPEQLFGPSSVLHMK